MSAVATRARKASVRPTYVETPLESVISRIASARALIGMALDAAENGEHIEMVLIGLEESLLPEALASLHGASVTKAEVDVAHGKLFFPLSVLNAAWVMSKGLVMESTLERAFLILDQAHSDMDPVCVSRWAIPDGAAASTPGVAAPEAPAATTFDTDAASLVLQRAQSISGLLMNLFGGGTAASAREMRELEGLMGAVQHLRRILKDLSDEVGESNDKLPDFFREGVFEAAQLATLFDEVEWLSGYKFHAGDAYICSYFDAVCAACEAADEALEKDSAT